MESRLKNINSFWGYLLIDELVRNGVSLFCISPGSRSTPLTIAAAENPLAENIICIDERGSAFYALGYAKATGKPAALICTSGTAAANYLPAIIEARQSRIPLIILTSDRPPELRGTGANQSIDQIRLYSHYPKWFFDLPCPNQDISPQMVLTTIDQAVFKANYDSPGPVHLNCMFREPLAPSNKVFPLSYPRSVNKWERSRAPYSAYHKEKSAAEDEETKDLAHLINRIRKAILVVGELPNKDTGKAVLQLAEKLRWPVFADITSGIRGNHPSVSMINHFDQLLLSEKMKNDLNAKIILHLGKPLVSKRYLQFIQAHPPQEYIHINSSSDREDPNHQITHRFVSDIESFCFSLRTYITGNIDKNWHLRIIDRDHEISELLKRQCQPDTGITEISLAYYVSKNINPDQGLFLSNSMPVRDFDMFASFETTFTNIVSNRGASGIDGTLATATGYASGLNKPVTAVIGDLAMIHDMNSLLLLDGSESPITLIIINNGGGGIFSFLPIAKYAHIFEQYFGTSHDYEFKYLAKMFGIKYSQPSTNEEFVRLYKKNINSKKSSIIEIKTERDDNYKLHQEFHKKVKTILEK
jgi:2-succinyl-5-enolpyruvyl-6-hydroxy-3-cyclohexene-1-carboxylate synthase